MKPKAKNAEWDESMGAWDESEWQDDQCDIEEYEAFKGWGFPESAPASAFGVRFGDSQKVPRGVLPRVPGKLGVLQGVLSRVLSHVKE